MYGWMSERGKRAKEEKRKGLKSSPAIAYYTKTKTEVVVVVAPSADDAIRGTASIRNVEPGTAPQR